MSENERDTWATPPSFYAGLNEQYGFDLDVCASDHNHKAQRYLTSQQDGLRQPWAPARCWCNPPYSNIDQWTEKAWHESERGALVAMLVPPRTDAKWWHRYAVRAAELLWVCGRIRFVPPPGIKESTPCEPSVVIVWNPGLYGPTSATIDCISGRRVAYWPMPEQTCIDK